MLTSKEAVRVCESGGFADIDDLKTNLASGINSCNHKVKKKLVKDDPRLDKLIELMYVKRLGEPMGRLMKMAGYSASYSNNPWEVKDSLAFKAKAKPYVDQIQALRQRAIDRMVDTVEEAPFRDVSTSLKSLDNINRLETGQATENIAQITKFEIPEVG